MKPKPVLFVLTLVAILLSFSIPVFAGVESIVTDQTSTPLVVVSATEEEEGITIRDLDLDLVYDEVEISPLKGKPIIYKGAAAGSKIYKGRVPWAETFVTASGQKMPERIRIQADFLFNASFDKVTVRESQPE